MMNLPIQFWAVGQLDTPPFKSIAIAHADTILKEFIREDVSVRHLFEFDCYAGEVKQYHGGQGYNPKSAWSLRATWAVDGLH
ncbi:hypothetical protein [Vibrio sp. qd031]|uniref:hypothetical protein n=1 Tax=Vibrio sp. qd031 TaxID=1603038 RepID=UPI00117E2070|nr:hypothetical protein [Vibrio sp. qd031]